MLLVTECGAETGIGMPIGATDDEAVLDLKVTVEVLVCVVKLVTQLVLWEEPEVASGVP